MNIEELIVSLPDKERSNINELKFTLRIPNVLYANGGQLKEWKALSMRERANIIRNSVLNHFANGGSMTDISIDDIRHKYEEGGEEDIYARANALLDEKMRQWMMENRPSYEDWINRERNKVTLAAFEYSNLRTSPSYIMLDNPYKTEEEWTSAMNSIIEERQKELNDSIKLNADQPPMILQMNISIAQLKLDDAIWEKNLGYSSKIPANSCLTTATDNYVQVTGDKSYGANLNSYFQNNHPGYEVVPGFEDAALGDIVLLLEDNGEAKHGMIYAGLNDLGQYIFNNSAGGSEDIAYKKGISFRSINNDKNPNDHVLILRFIGNDLWNKDKEEDYNLRYPIFMLGGNLFDEGGAEKNEKKTLFEPIEHPVIPEVPSDQDTMDWLANWYNNRRKQLYNNRIQARKNLLTYSSLPSSISDLINNYEIGRTELNKLYYRKLNSLAYPVTIPVPEEEYYTTRFYGNSGVNKGDTIFINYNHVTPNSKQELETKVHERVHSLLDPGYFRGFNELTDITNDILVPKETPSSEYDKYLNDGREGYPRLMEFRRIHDINPNKVWNVEEVKQLLELDEKDKEEHQLYKWTPESVTKALNEVAYRNQNNAIIQAANGGTLLHLLNDRGYLFTKGGPKETLEENSPADLMRNDNIGFLQGYYPEVTIPKLSLYEAADNSGITLVPYLGDAVDAMQAANLAKEGKYAEAAILGSTLLIPNILEKPLKFLGTKALKYFEKGIETSEDLMKLSDDDWYSAYKTALYLDDKEGAKTILELRILTKKESGLEVMPFKTNLEKLYVLKPSFIRDYKTYKNLFLNWNLDKDYFYKKYRTTIGDLRKRYDNLKVQDGKRRQKLLEDIDTNKTILKLEIELAVKEGKIPENFLEDLEFYTMDTYGRIPEYDSDKHLILAPWKNELKLTITTDPQTGQLIYDLLPIHLNSKYRYVGKDAYEDYVSRGIVSNIDDEGKALTRYSFPMFSSRNPSSYGFDDNKIWLVSKPDAPLEWESVKGAAITPIYEGVPNKAPLNMFDVFLESPEGFRKLLGFGGTLLLLFNNGSYLFAKGGPENELTLADEKVNYSYFLHPIDAFRYNGSPSYNTDIPFATAFTDAIRNNLENFQWGDNIYNTDIDWKHHFSKDEKGNNPFKEFAEVMYPAVIKVLLELGLPITNAHNIVRQAAIESNYGTDPRGALGYNLSGIKWTKSADPKYKHTTGADGEEYIDFDNLKDYIYYKVKILNDNYDALNAKNAKDFARRLHPNAAGIPTNLRASGYKGDYSGDYNSYKNNITNLNSLDKTLFHQMYKPLFGK